MGMMNKWPEWIREDIKHLVSVDVETSGPNPANYDMLSIGACTLLDPKKTFYVELQPLSDRTTEEAQSVHGLDMESLIRDGHHPAQAMQMFSDWLKDAVAADDHALFLGFNSPFDWMFVSDYFHRYLGINPFGHSALDIKSFYMGFARVPWKSTRMKNFSTVHLKHNALEDACDQAKLFEHIVLHTV
jgi:ribonuclease T